MNEFLWYNIVVLLILIKGARVKKKGIFVIMANGDTTLNIRIDKELKTQADKLFSELGLSLTSAVNVFIRQAVRQGKIPFEISLNTPNAVTSAVMQEVEDISKN